MDTNDIFNEEDAKVINLLLFDENNDGSIDTILQYKKNSDGRICEVTLDYDEDGIADCKIFLKYDSLGRISKKAIDKNLSGKINAVETIDYNEFGYKLVSYDDNADGLIDYMTFYNKDGKEDTIDMRDVKDKVIDTIKNIFPDKIVKFFEK